MDELTLKEVRRSHYEKMAPLIKRAREIIEESLESDNERLRFEAARYVLGESEQWLESAAGKRVEEIPPEERKDPMDFDFGPSTTRTVKTLSADVTEALE